MQLADTPPKVPDGRVPGIPPKILNFPLSEQQGNHPFSTYFLTTGKNGVGSPFFDLLASMLAAKNA